MADTVLAMLEPKEFVIKKSSAEKIGYKNLNKMNRSGKMPKAKYSSYNEGGEVKEGWKTSSAYRKWKMSVSARHGAKRLAREKAKLEMPPREFRKTLEGKAPDLDNDLWERYIKGGDLVLSSLKEEQGKRDKLAKAKGKASKMRAAGYKLPQGLNKGGKVPKAKYQGYKKGGEVDKPYHGTTRELALRVYQKQMIGKPLKGSEKEYSKSESYKAFTKTKPYEESGHQIRGHALSEPAMEKAKRMKAAGYKLPPGLKKGGEVKKKARYSSY